MALSRVAKKSDLSFEDAGSLKDAIDRKAEGYLRACWGKQCSAGCGLRTDSPAYYFLEFGKFSLQIQLEESHHH